MNRTIHWHRPLLWLAFAMAALAIFCTVAIFVDHRQLLGVDVWEKPLKFAVSTSIYAITWSWLIPQLGRARRLAWWAGTVSAILLLVELIIITGAAGENTTSHFNVSTPLATTLWAIMAGSISTVWVMTFMVSVLLFRSTLGDAARSLAIRAGAILALVGMGLAFLMTGPKGDQISNYTGIIGAHAVGVADGGPGLPLLGWSTVGGDLRIPHFVGMHALQAIPISLILLELASHRVPVLRDVTVRFRLVLIAATSYLAVLGVLTWQALRGESIVHPDAQTLFLGAAVAAVATVAVLAVFAVGRTYPMTAPGFGRGT